MNKAKIAVGLILIVLGVVVLVYGGFNYTKETHGTELGPLKFEFKEKDRVEIPTWVGIGLVAAGTITLLVRKRRS